MTPKSIANASNQSNIIAQVTLSNQPGETIAVEDFLDQSKYNAYSSLEKVDIEDIAKISETVTYILIEIQSLIEAFEKRYEGCTDAQKAYLDDEYSGTGRISSQLPWYKSIYDAHNEKRATGNDLNLAMKLPTRNKEGDIPLKSLQDFLSTIRDKKKLLADKITLAKQQH